ncbi:hypothetical protein OMP40_10845 [Cohnella rhizosphaerae]|uniref:Aerobactin siderophore biosynthesis IucA/IucC-like C-terminal domain-containing protein n=1 Tax=Cohnella rhizosphaerae TaxID=1457232 RepID=A0A9X4KS96_9BACL|nr:IucA/IucC family C-terminal-domain containing protein [Cohnella rhizosphaerae]MDG0809778.1 hypothetical protein [Cohnella rhizosphaerae]
MTAAFSNEELDKLAGEFRFATAPSADRSMSIRAADLLDPDLCIAYLDRVNAVFEATTRTACASLFAKRYSCLAMASSLYAMSVLNKCFDYGLDNCHVESHYQGSPWLPRVRLDDRSLTQPGPLGREAWRESVLRRVFADNLSRVWGSLSKAGPVSKAVLWENTAIYVHWLYEDRFVEGAGEEEAARLREDYRYLMSGAPGGAVRRTRQPVVPLRCAEGRDEGIGHADPYPQNLLFLLPGIGRARRLLSDLPQAQT